MWENVVVRGRPQMAIWRMRIACWITRAKKTNTHTHIHTEYLTLMAFTWKQWIRERASVLGYRYIACLVVMLLAT
jgi:hypothetical protein